MSRGFASNCRVGILSGLILSTFAVLGTRLVQLHVIDREHLLTYVEHVRREIIPSFARRGDIRDIRGGLLATSLSLVVVGVDPGMARPEDASKWPKLAKLVGLPLPRLQQILTTRYRTVSPSGVVGVPGLVLNFKVGTAAEGASISPPLGSTAPGESLAASAAVHPPANADDDPDDDTVMDDPDAAGRRPIRWAKLSDSVDEASFAEIEKLGVRGVYGTNVYRRAYPHNELAAHLIGYVNREEKPVAGIEAYANFFLRGQNGWVETEKDGHRRELAQFRTREVPAADGYGVVLSIDSTVQHMAEAELDAIREKYQPKKATIIVSDPRTGFILAMANYPTFNLNEYNRLPASEMASMRNAAVSDLYEPGSVFKIIAVSSALDAGLVTPGTTFDCTLDKIEYNGRVRPLPPEDAGDHFDHPLSVAEIISRSSNKGAVQLAMRLGEKRYYEYVHAFGIGLPTGFPVGGEPDARSFRLFVPPPEKWDGLTFTRMPMGQSVAVTALQMHQAMGVIASGGVLLRPQIIKQIQDASGGIVYRFDRVEERRVLKEATARTMERLLLGVTSGEDSTGFRAAIPGYDVAGKTGTTQKLVPVTLASGGVKLVYSKVHHVASFVGFFPATNPQIAISVIVDDADAHAPGGIAYGGLVAAPVFKHLGEQLIPYRDIRPPSQPGVAGRSLLALEGGRR